MAKVLVIDDEEDVRRAIQRRLKREGYDVEIADGELSGLEAIDKNNYDVVITDMSMEDPLSGKRVLAKAVSKDMFTQVIVLTAYGNVSNAVDCMRLGAFDYVEKNIPGIDTYELVVLKLEQALDERRVSLRAMKRMEYIAQLRDQMEDEQ